jgi:hypothetical protein
MYAPFTAHLAALNVSLVCPTAPLREVEVGIAPMWFERAPGWMQQGLGSTEDSDGTDASLEQV